MKLNIVSRSVLAALLLGATSAGAATITSERLEGTPYTIAAGQFTTLSTTFNTLGSVTTSCGVPADGRSAILKCPTDPVPDGRYNPTPHMPWIDSADIGALRWDVGFDKPVRAFGFGVTDAADTFTPDGDPFWRLTVDGATVSHPRLFNDEGEPVTWYTVVFDVPVLAASLVMETGRGDGYGITSATVAPIPLPAGGLLMLAALGGFGALRLRRRTPAA